MSGFCTTTIDHTGRAFATTIGYNAEQLPIRITVGSHDGSKKSDDMTARDVTPFLKTRTSDGGNSVFAPAATQIAMVVVVKGEDAMHLDATHIAVSMHANTAITNAADVPMLYCKLKRHGETSIVLASVVGGESFGVCALGANVGHADIAKHADLDSGTWTMRFKLAKKVVEEPTTRSATRGITRSKGEGMRGGITPFVVGSTSVMRGGAPVHSELPCTPGENYLEAGHMSVAYNAGQDNSVYGKAEFTQLMDSVSVAFAIRVGWNDTLLGDIVTHSSGQNAAKPTEEDLAVLAMIDATRKPLALENNI